MTGQCDVLFRCDSSTEIGTGHAFRCLTLAEHLSQQGRRCLFLAREMTPDLVDLIANHHRLQWIPSWAGLSEEIGLISVAEPETVVLDHYQIGRDWQTAVRKIARLVVIDDLADHALDAHLVLNFNYGLPESAYDSLLPKDCERRVGPRFSILKKSILELRRNPPPKKNQIFCFFGGSDPTRESGKLCAALSALPRREESIVIFVGAAAPERETLAKQRSDAFEICTDPSVFHRRLAESKIFLGAGGTVTYERLFLGVPGFVVAVAENQIPMSSALARDEYQVYLGPAAQVDYSWVFAKIQSAPADRLRSMSERGQQLVQPLDGVEMQRLFFPEATEMG